MRYPALLKLDSWPWASLALADCGTAEARTADAERTAVSRKRKDWNRITDYAWWNWTGFAFDTRQTRVDRRQKTATFFGSNWQLVATLEKKVIGKIKSFSTGHPDFKIGSPHSAAADISHLIFSMFSSLYMHRFFYSLFSLISFLSVKMATS